LRRALSLVAVIGLGLGPGCRGAHRAPAADAGLTPSGSTAVLVSPDRDARLRALSAAEHERATSKVSTDDLTSRDVEVRRRAVRALARIADDEAIKALSRALSDEDAEVVAWAAYGLGFACKGRETATVRMLVSRAASLAAEPPQPGSRLDVHATLSDALARCGNPEAEATLRAWLDDEEHADDAALALGRLASRKKRLDDASIVALLDAASRPDKAPASALFAFTRLSGLSETVQSRLLEVCVEAIGGPPGMRRAFAVRALGRAGPKAVPPLSKVLASDGFSVAERADAARELAKLGDEGQAALRYALGQLAPKITAKDTLGGEQYGVLASVVESLAPPARDAKKSLEHLADLEVSSDFATLKLRAITLRCRAAVLLAGDAIAFPKLASCDPDPQGTAGKLALLRVIDRGPIGGARLSRWRALVEDKSPLVRQAAIELMAAHPEIAAPQPILAKALRAPDAGTVAAAAQVISAYPDRAAEKRPNKTGQETKEADTKDKVSEGPFPVPITPHPAVVDALRTAFTVQRPPDSIEVWAALVSAAGALQLLSFKPKLDAFCTSDNPTLREHAEKALHLMGEQKRTCKASGPGKTPAELEHAPPAQTSVVFETDAGPVELTLDGSLAPVAVERFIELAKSGFFDHVVIHRVVPGFVVQFGDPGADGYGGAGKEPLRCETSPVPFEPYTVGVALSGRDTGSSQLFVTLGAFPHLDGDYAWIGRAKPGWERIAQGDVIQRARVTP
jgi:cyclophilin family peptidyl-prolyl cis-trans isomerase/HEAT repeat protein